MIKTDRTELGAVELDPARGVSRAEVAVAALW